MSRSPRVTQTVILAGNKILGAPPDVGIKVPSRHTLDRTHNQATDNGPANAVQATKDNHRKHFEPYQRQQGGGTKHIAPDDASGGGCQAGNGPRQGKHSGHPNPHDHRSLLIVGHGAHSDTESAAGEKQPEGDQEDQRDHRRDDVNR